MAAPASNISRLRPPPKHLGPDGRRFWIATIRDYEIGSESLRAYVRVAAEALDRLTQCAEAVRQDGLTVTDRYGAKAAHPLLKVEAAARQAFGQAMRALRLQPGQDEK